MKQEGKHVAYIDAANLDRGIKSLGWRRLDYKKFRTWLRDKYDVSTAYIFIGFIPSRNNLYEYFRDCGFIMIFKEVTFGTYKEVKGNCDTDLVLQATRDYYEGHCRGAVVISSDGDYAGLIKFLKEKNSFLTLISPRNKCSFLLKKMNIPILYLDSQKTKLQKEV